MDMTLRDLFQIPCFKEAGSLLFPTSDLKNLSLEQSIESAAKQSLSWLPPHAIEGLNFTLEHGRYYAYPLGGSGCFVYPHPGAKRVLFILPGGGYGSLSTLAEGLPFAQQAFLAGDAAVVVGYRYGKEAAYPNVLDDLAMAVSLVYQKRVLGEEVLPYTLLGFSAGGHLAGVFASEAEGYSRYHLPSPSALALAYPVVSLLPPTNQETAMVAGSPHLTQMAVSFVTNSALANKAAVIGKGSPRKSVSRPATMTRLPSLANSSQRSTIAKSKNETSSIAKTSKG